MLLHEGVVDGRSWARVVPALSERHRVVVYDQRGYGRSARIDGAYSNVRDLRALLDELGLERVSLVGASRGGRIALEFTLSHPHRVRRLVLVAAGLRGRPLNIEGTPEQEARWAAAETRGDSAELAELDLEVWAPLGADDELRAMFLENAETSNAEDPEAHPEWTPADRLAEVRVPTLVINGDDDVPALNEVGERLAREIPGARRVVIAAADHMIAWRQPEEVAALLIAFLD